jgi:hypothetical protein
MCLPHISSNFRKISLKTFGSHCVCFCLWSWSCRCVQAPWRENGPTQSSGKKQINYTFKPTTFLPDELLFMYFISCAILYILQGFKLLYTFLL